MVAGWRAHRVCRRRAATASTSIRRVDQKAARQSPVTSDARRRALAVVDARTAASCSRTATTSREGRATDPGLAVGSLRRRAGRRLRRVASAGPADRHDRQRNASARLARRPARRLRVGSRFDRRRRSVGDAGAGSGRREAGAARRPRPRAQPAAAGGAAPPDAKPSRREPAAARGARHSRARRRSRRRRGRPTTNASRSMPCATASDRCGSPPSRRRRARATSPQCRGRSPPRRRSWPRAWAARLPGRRTAARCSSPACRNRNRSTTAIRCATRPSLRRSLRRRARFSCGACRRRCRSTPTAACSPPSSPPTPALVHRGFHAHVANAARSLLLDRRVGRQPGLRLRDKYQPRARGCEERRGARRRHRRDGRASSRSSSRTSRPRRGRRLGPSARVGSRAHGAREGRQRRRRDDRGVVRARRARARSVGAGRRRRGGVVSEGDEAADGRRLQGP